MDEAAFNRGPGRQLGFFERRRLKKLLFETWFPNFKEVAEECADAYATAKLKKAPGSLVTLTETVSELARSPCQRLLLILLKHCPDTINGHHDLPMQICKILELVGEPLPMLSGLSFPFRRHRDSGTSNLDLAFEGKYQCPSSVWSDHPAGASINDYFTGELKAMSLNAFSLHNAQTQELYGIFGPAGVPEIIQDQAHVKLFEMRRTVMKP